MLQITLKNTAVYFQFLLTFHSARTQQRKGGECGAGGAAPLRQNRLRPAEGGDYSGRKDDIWNCLCWKCLLHYFCYTLGDGRGIVGLLSAALQSSGPFRDGKLCVRMCIASTNITWSKLKLKPILERTISVGLKICFTLHLLFTIFYFLTELVILFFPCSKRLG